MKTLRVRNDRSGAVLGREVQLADSWWRRAVGLLGRRELPEGTGLLLAPCASVHTMGMRFSLDLAFLDGNGRVLNTRPAMGPGRVAMGPGDVWAALELPAGTLGATDTREGDFLILEERRP